MHKIKDNLVLFCGGESQRFTENVPKPLLKLNDKEIIINYLEQLNFSIFNRTILLVEENWVKKFNALVTGYKNVEVFEVKNSSSTLQKLKKFIDEYNDHSEYTIFSYPDIFVAKSYWKQSNKSTNKVVISQKPLTSRFPRIFTSPFNNKVKGVSDYNSKVPANPHYIFAGKFYSNTKFLQNMLETFLSKNDYDNLEVSFFDWLAANGSLVSESYIDEWIICDSARDFKEINDLIKMK